MAVDFARLDAAVMGAFREVEPILYGPRFEPDFAVPGIFDTCMVEVPGPGDGPPVLVARSTLAIRAEDLPPGYAPKPLDRVLIRDVTYDVTGAALPDAAGWILLQLGRVE
ncbi:head-tail joining protein [Falsiroseomonas sp.]|uniref:head-tail joining protein n=1 Tax=Falsiroseomonas sp. TaxID=2870721 RepID=UPI003F6F608E